MQYPLHEKIGQPDLLVGREEEFRNFHKWIDNIPRMISKSRVILARRKSGKTSFVQRLFNELCMADPFFISCVIQSNYAQRDLTTTSGVIDTVDYEISDRNSEMSKTWAEYIGLTLQRVNDQYAKQILLHLSKHADRCWTPQELKDELHIEQDIYTIQDKLITMAESDMINRGRADIDFCGLQDGTLNLVLRNRFEKEINNFVPDFRAEFSEKIAGLEKENRRLRGMLNHLSGKLAESQLTNELRTRKRFRFADYFAGGTDAELLNIIAVQERVTFQRTDGKGQELDVVAEADNGRTLLIEVRKRQAPTALTDVADFWDKVTAWRQQFPAKVALPAFLSLGGFTAEAQAFCAERHIGVAESIAYH